MNEVLSSIKEHIVANGKGFDKLIENCGLYVSSIHNNAQLDQVQLLVVRHLYILAYFQSEVVDQCKTSFKDKKHGPYKDLLEQELVQLEIKMQLLAAQLENTRSDSYQILKEVDESCIIDALKIFSKIQNICDSAHITVFEKNLCQRFLELIKDLKTEVPEERVDLSKIIENYFSVS